MALSAQRTGPPLLTVTDPDLSCTSLTLTDSCLQDPADGEIEAGADNLSHVEGTEHREGVNLTSSTEFEGSFDHSQQRLSLPVRKKKSTSLPNQPTRRLSANLPQGGAVFLTQRRKQKSFDMSMLSRESNDLEFFKQRDRSPSPAPEDGQASPTIKVDFCDYVVEEILLTEQQYVKDLQDIVQGYLDYSKRCLHITAHEVTGIFSNIEELYNFHISFVSQLEECKEEPVAIAKCFIDRGAEFEIYARYVTNYPSSINCLSKLLRKPLVNEAYRKQQLILGHGLPVGSYLHKPVQRILKYHLLLQNLLKHFPEDTFGRETITTSLQCMTDCAHNINELKRSHEHAMKIQEIQSTLYNFEGHNLLDFGDLVIEGELRMHGARSFRYVYLFEKGVIICKRREDGAMSCKTTIMCDNLMLVESIAREPLSFHLIPFDDPKSQNTFQAKTLEQKREWCNLVKKYMLESYDIPEKAKELLLALTGKSEGDEKFAKQFKAAMFTLKAHQTPDYIERKRRKSQPYTSSSALADGFTRPSKNSVCTASADPQSSRTLPITPPTPWPITPPFSRMSRSMSSPVSPEELGITNIPADNGVLTTCEEPCHCMFKVEPALHAINEALSVTPPGNAGSMKSGDNSHYKECDRSGESCNQYQSTSDGIYNHTLISVPTIEITDTSGYVNSDKEVEHRSLHALTVFPPACEQPCGHRGNGLANINNLLFTPVGISRGGRLSARQRRCRRHSLPDLLPTADSAGTFCEWRSHDEDSSRARLLKTLLSDRYSGFDDSIWSPEITCVARRFQIPLLKRTDSYSQAVRGSSEKVIEFSLVHTDDTLEHSRRSMSSSLDHSAVNETSHREELADKDLMSGCNSGVSTLRKGKTETSIILNKLSQLKERTSNRLTDLLKRSPVKRFKDSTELSLHTDHYDNTSLPCDSHSVVGRRLSNADSVSVINLSAYSDKSQEDISENEVSHGQSFRSHSSPWGSSQIDTLNSATLHSSISHILAGPSDTSNSSTLHSDSPQISTLHSDSTQTSTLHSDSTHSSTLLSDLSHSFVPRQSDSDANLDPPVKQNAENTIFKLNNSRNNEIFCDLECQGNSGDNDVTPLYPGNGSSLDNQVFAMSASTSTNTRDSIGSMLSTNEGSLERNVVSAHYSSGNLADVEGSDWDGHGYEDNNNTTITTQKKPVHSVVDTKSGLEENSKLIPDITILNKEPDPLANFSSVQDLCLEGGSDKIESNTVNQQHPLSNALESEVTLDQSVIGLNRPTSSFWDALDNYINTGEIERSSTSKPVRPIKHGGSFSRRKREKDKTCALQSNSTDDDNDDRVKFLSGDDRANTLPSTSKNKVYRMARKYSTRIKNPRSKIMKKSRMARDEEEGSGSPVKSPQSDILTRQQIDRPKYTRQRSLQAENTQEIIGDSGVQQCDLDSGSDCNDIYEQQSLAALESFTSDDEMRDSAIYSDAEDLLVASFVQRVSPIRVCDHSVIQNSILDHEYELVTFPLIRGEDDAEVGRRRCKSLPRSRSLSSHSTITNGTKTNSVDDIVSRPVSSSLLIRLEALKKCSQFEKEGCETGPLANLNSVAATLVQRRQLLSRSTSTLSRQQSAQQIEIEPGLVRQVKDKLHVK